jgi:hypothetical protein
VSNGVISASGWLFKKISSARSETGWLYLLIVDCMSELNQVMLFVELIALSCENRTKQSAEFLLFKPGDTIVTTGLYRVEGNEILICGLYGSVQGRIQACGGP